jgi:hypothetical protein
MSLYITRFVDRLRSAESRGMKEVSMSLEDARNLHAELTKILARLEEVNTKPTEAVQEVIQVEIQGGKF